MQHAHKRKQPPCGFEIDRHFAFEPPRHQRRAFVVQAPAAHVDGLDARLAAFLNRLDMALDQHLVVADQPAERPHGEADGL